jgi:hypothetical protein
MKNICLLLLLVLGWFSIPVLGQASQTNPAHSERMEKIRSAKAAFIGEKLNLTTEQDQKFWPVYHEYESKRHALRGKSRPFRHAQMDNLSEQQLLEGLRTMQSAQQMELDLEKEYTDRFLKILTVRQVVNFHRAEREFTKALLHKMDSRQGGKPNL